MKKIGILDVIIVMIVIIMGFIGFKVLSGQSAAPTEKQEISYTLEIRGAEKSLVEAIQENDVLYNSTNNSAYGVITNVAVEPATEITTDINAGELKLFTYNDKYDIYIDITGQADSIDDKNITIAEEKLKVGSMAYITSAKYTGSGYIVKIDRTEGGNK